MVVASPAQVPINKRTGLCKEREMRESGKAEVTDTLALPKTRTSKVQVREWSLEVAGGPDKGKKVKTLEALIRVGTDPSNDLVLSDTTVSRRHVEVERVGERLLVRDLGSRNGTFIDGRQIVQAFLEPGDKIVLGKTKLALKEETRTTSVELAGADSVGDMVGTSEKMRAVFALLRKVTKEDMNLLLEGETGTGKELAARAVHKYSARGRGTFRIVDCHLMTAEAAERELFGTSDEPGVFEATDGGTVFLDEVGELPASLQPKLLRVIESREVRRSGQDAKEVDVRIIAATSKNLEEEVAQERFRSDLYFRLAVAKVKLPPLRTRKEDIPVLAEHILSSLNATFELTPQTLSLFEGYDWPGNVRELRNVLERGALMQETGSTNWLEFLANPVTKGQTATKSVGAMATNLQYHEAKDRVLADFERFYFAEVMKGAGFDMKIAEQKTGLSMQSLYRLLKKNGLRLKDLKNADGLK
jgi:two-component system, NtrC family, response regulator GlrR